MRKVTAHFDLSIWATCPHCESSYDYCMLDIWEDDSPLDFTKRDYTKKVECPDCNEEFIIKEAIY